MQKITPNADMHFKVLNDEVRTSTFTEIEIDNCIGQRYIASGLKGKTITINGTPGNALGAYLDGADITVNGNVQDATGDTMNDGDIIVHGNAGDATGYAMRGGAILIKGYTGYRAGIHMKAYKEKQPLVVIGNNAGSFLGEYQAGGTIVVLGLATATGDLQKIPITGPFCATGMHGGRICLRTTKAPTDLPKNIEVAKVTGTDVPELEAAIKKFCNTFGTGKNKEIAGVTEKQLLSDTYCLLTPNTKNPYKQMYVMN